MKTITVRGSSSAAPEAMWSVIADLEHAADHVTGIDAVEVLTTGPFGAGTRWRETRTMFGRSATEEMEVTAVDPGRSYTVEAESSGVHYVSTFVIEPTTSGCALTMSFGGEATGTVSRVLGALMSPLMRGSMSKALQQDVDDLCRAAESGSART